MSIKDALPPPVDQRMLQKLPVRCGLQVPEAHDRPYEQSQAVSYRVGVTARKHMGESVPHRPSVPTSVQAETMRARETHNIS